MSSITAQEIIDQADLLVPSSLTAAQKVAILNDVQTRVFRKVKFPNSKTAVVTFDDKETYTIPSGCQPDRIERVFLQKDRHILTAAEVTIYIGSVETDDLATYDLNDSDTITSADATIVTDRGGSLVLAEGTETTYQFERFVNSTTVGYKYSVNDTAITVRPIPDVNGGTLSGVSVTDGGSAFTSAPTLVVTGDGSGAAGTITVSGGVVTAVTLTDAGSGYSYARATASGGGGTGCVLTAAVNLSNIVFEYQPNPTAFSATDLTITPSTPPDYDWYYVFTLSSRMAKIGKDSDLANGLEADANEVLAQMIQDFSTSPDAGFQVSWSW